MLFCNFARLKTIIVKKGEIIRSAQGVRTETIPRFAGYRRVSQRVRSQRPPGGIRPVRNVLVFIHGSLPAGTIISPTDNKSTIILT